MSSKFFSLNFPTRKLNSANRLWFYASGLVWLLSLDILSWLGWDYPVVGSLMALTIGLVWFYIASRNITIGVGWLILELIIGSFGLLFNLSFGSTTISLRLILFLFALGLINWRLWFKRDYVYLLNRSVLWYGLALLGIGWALMVALARGNAWGSIFLDLNGYLYLLLWPLFVIMAATDESWLSTVKKFVYLGLGWLGLRTIIIFYLYSHFDSSYLWPLYQWYRDLGLGEITYISGNYFRIFSQSQIWSLLAAAAGFIYLAADSGIKMLKNRNYLLYLMIWFNLVIVIISLSRSFWLGGLTVWLLISLWLVVKKWQQAIRYVIISGVIMLSAMGAVRFINQVPWPAVPAASGNALASRFSSNEAAGQSRWNLLKPLVNQINTARLVGYGLGADITYHSLDPRVVASTAGGIGVVTVTAFEWGYLDMWLKFGLVGLLALLGFLLQGWGRNFFKWWRAVDVKASWFIHPWLALLVVNITTPYLNHPLGLGAIMLILAVVLQGDGSKTLFVAKAMIFKRDQEDEQNARKRSSSYDEDILGNLTQSQSKNRDCSRNRVLKPSLYDFGADGGSVLEY